MLFARYAWARAKLTVFIVLACLIVFGLEAIGAGGYDVLSGTGRGLSPALELGVVFRPAIDAGEWWRLITAGFLHFGAVHLALNLYALIYVGVAIEPRYGHLRFAAIYLAALVGGNLAADLLQSPQTFSAGASGAIMGMFGAMAIVGIRFKVQRVWLQSALWPIVATLAYGFSQPGISNVAHIGGLLCGAATAWLVGVSPAWLRLIAPKEAEPGSL